MKSGTLVIFAALVAACDVEVTVGYNQSQTGGPVSPESCPDDALFRPCSTESCVVAEIADAQIGMEAVAVDADNIYFITEPDTLSRMPKAGGAAVALTSSSGYRPRIALDEAHVYFSEHDGNIFRVPKAGGSASLITKIFGHPLALASHDDDLYVAMTDSGEVAKISKSTGAETRLTGESAPTDLTVDAEHVYWVNQGQPGGATGELVRAPLGDLTGREVILSNLEEPLRLGVTADSFLWATYDKVFRLARTGGEPQSFEIPFDEPKGVTEFDGIIYAAGMFGLYRIRVADGAALALDPRGFTGIALGCDGLYGVGWHEPILIRYGR